jgi:site-specific recombinase XerD
VEIQALLGHATLTTTQIDTNAGEDRMAAVVNKL